MEWKTITKNELKELISTNTYVSLGKMFGISGVAVKKKAKKFGIWERKTIYNGHNDHLRGISKSTGEQKICLWCGGLLTKHSKKYCTGTCQQVYLHHIYINKWLLGVVDGSKSNGMNVSDRVRRYIFEKYDNKCSECGWSKVNPRSGKIPLEIDHIDGNGENNSPSNLTLLCPNCHSLTPTYRALNIGVGSRKRQEYHGGHRRYKK